MALQELKQLKSDAVQQDKTPIYMVEFDEGPCYYLLDQIDFDLFRHWMEISKDV